MAWDQRPDRRTRRVDEGVAPPHPSQIRMCRFPASGSSWESLARGGVDDTIRDSPVKKVSKVGGPPSFRSCKFSYPLSFRGQVCETQSSPPMFPVNGSLHMAPLFPRSGPGESGSPMSQVLSRCYDFPPRISGHLFASLPGSTRSSSVRVSQLALPEGRRAFRAGVNCSTGDPICRFAGTWT